MPNRRAAEGQKTTLNQRPRGITRVAALWQLCRYRHKTHATGHIDRLARPSLISTKREDYAREELVAELGAAFVSATIGIKLHDREDHAAYLASWLQALRNDKRCIFTAARLAQDAADWLLSRMAIETPEQMDEAA